MTELREFERVKQVKGEPKRRWFTCNELDLYVWMNDENDLIGFQFCFNKNRGEHAVTWLEERGFSYTAIDDGESLPNPGHKSAPVLVPNGAINLPNVLNTFLSASETVPVEIAEFVENKLRCYPDGSAT